MAGLRMVSCAVLAWVLLLAVYAQAQEQSPCPPENPFCPVWVPCNYTEVQGPYCQDCSTRVICTANGGLVKPCRFPGSAHCVNGQCVSQPSQECAPQSSSSPGTTPDAESTQTELTEQISSVHESEQ